MTRGRKARSGELQRRQTSAVAGVAALAFALASCAGSTPETATPATIGGVTAATDAESTTTTTAPPTTAPPPTVPPTTAPPTTAPPLFSLGFTGAEGFLGSGCTPQQDVLPDGVWFGAIDSWGENTLQFDLMCNQIGDGSSAPVITNENPKLRTVVFTDESTATVRIDGGFLMTLDEFAELHPTLRPTERLVIIEVIAGRLTRLELPT